MGGGAPSLLSNPGSSIMSSLMFGPNSEYISAVSLYLLELTRSAQEKKTPVFSEKRIMHFPFPSKGNCICISVTKLSKVIEEYYMHIRVVNT